MDPYGGVKGNWDEIQGNLQYEYHLFLQHENGTKIGIFWSLGTLWYDKVQSRQC